MTDDKKSGEAPAGPLGGPEPKTREELLEEQKNREEVSEDHQTPRPTETPPVPPGEASEDHQAPRQPEE